MRRPGCAVFPCFHSLGRRRLLPSSHARVVNGGHTRDRQRGADDIQLRFLHQARMDRTKINIGNNINFCRLAINLGALETA